MSNAGKATFTTALSDNTNLQINNTSNDQGSHFTMYNASSSPANDDILGSIDFNGNDSTGTETIFGRIRTGANNVANGSEGGFMSFAIQDSGSLLEHMRVNTAGVVVNEISQAGTDFRVESNDNTHALFVDAGSNQVNIFTSSSISTGSNSDVGCTFFTSGQIALQSDDASGSGATLQLGRINADDGDQMIRFGSNGTGDRGSINMRGNEFIAIGSGDTFLEFNFGSDQINPSSGSAYRDDAIDLGTSSARFDDIFATNGTINTSDRNEKQDIEDLSEAEKKGEDARIHVGVIAQDLQAAFEAEGLDASKYAMFCSDTWTNDDGNEQTRLGVRYSELLAFIIAAI